MIGGIIKCSAGLDVHKDIVVCTVLRETEGSLDKQIREYATYHQQLEELAQWLETQEVALAVMESTGVYWKAVYEAIEEVGVKVIVVNAQHIKKVPGRKTDVADSEWLAELARCGLLKASFIPPKDLRQLRLLTRYRLKLSGYLASEQNRLHKVLDDGGIKLGSVVSSIDGVSAQRMIESLIAGQLSPQEIAKLACGSLRHKEQELARSLVGRLSDRHQDLLKRIQNHIKWLNTQIADIDSQVVAAMKPYEQEWQLLQTLPGIDYISAAILLAEIGIDMSQFGNKERLCSWAGMSPGNNESGGKKKWPNHKRQPIRKTDIM